MFVHTLPTTRAISFTDYLHVSRWSVEITQTTERRSKLQQIIQAVNEQKAISSSNSNSNTNTNGDDSHKNVLSLLSQKDWIKVVQSVDDYLPFLYGIVDSIKTDEVLLKGELFFSWKDTLSSSSSSSSSSRVTLPGIQYELLSSLILQAKALCNFAASLVASLGNYEITEAATMSDEIRKRKEDRLRFAADLQCRASGIFQHVGNQVIPEWEYSEGVSRLSQMGRSVESTGELCFALSKLAHAEAELLAIRKLLSPCTCYQTAHQTSSPPLASTHPSPSLLSKLYLNVASLYETALSLAQTASNKAGIRTDLVAPSSATEEGKKKSQVNRSMGAVLKHKLTGKSTGLNSQIEESTTSGKVSSDFTKYLFKGARASRARAYFWLGVDRGERGQYGEALTFLKLSSDELEVSTSGKRIHLSRSDKSREEKKGFAEDKDELNRLIGLYADSYKRLNDSVAFQPIPSSASLTSQIPAGVSATAVKAYVAPLPSFGARSIDQVSSSVQSIKGLGPDDTSVSEEATVEYAGKGAYY